eukprot:364786-Chlamydomonas_euryale.AAC.13
MHAQRRPSARNEKSRTAEHANGPGTARHRRAAQAAFPGALLGRRACELTPPLLLGLVLLPVWAAVSAQRAPKQRLEADGLQALQNLLLQTHLGSSDSGVDATGFDSGTPVAERQPGVSRALESQQSGREQYQGGSTDALLQASRHATHDQEADAERLLTSVGGQDEGISSPLRQHIAQAYASIVQQEGKAIVANAAQDNGPQPLGGMHNGSARTQQRKLDDGMLLKPRILKLTDVNLVLALAEHACQVRSARRAGPAKLMYTHEGSSSRCQNDFEELQKNYTANPVNT